MRRCEGRGVGNENATGIIDREAQQPTLSGCRHLHFGQDPAIGVVHGARDVRPHETTVGEGGNGHRLGLEEVGRFRGGLVRAGGNGDRQGRHPQDLEGSREKRGTGSNRRMHPVIVAGVSHYRAAPWMLRMR